MAESHATGTTARTEVPMSHGKPEFPPFNKDTFASQLVSFAVAFALLYVIVSRFALPRVGGVIKAREGTIEKDLSEAQAFRDESDAALKAYEAELAEARSRAQAIGSAEACLVNRNDPMHDSVPYLRNALQDDTDILHEYFIPRSQFVSFVDGMRKIMTDNKTNLLNASVRVVDRENNFLTYSPEPAFSLVLYINQSTDDEGNRKMEKITKELIDLTIAHKGRFFLPYQLYYSREQLQKSYPQIGEFFAAKKKYDPGEVFTNTFYQKYGA